MKRSRWLRAAAVREITTWRRWWLEMGMRMWVWRDGGGRKRVGAYFIIFWSGFGDGDFFEGVVDFSGLAVDFLDGDCGGHGGELGEALAMSSRR